MVFPDHLPGTPTGSRRPSRPAVQSDDQAPPAICRRHIVRRSFRLPNDVRVHLRNDEALRHARIFDTMIGDAQAFERTKENASPAFSTCKAIDVLATRVKLDPTSRKVLLIDARDIISKHNDVRNEEVRTPRLGALIKNGIPR